MNKCPPTPLADTADPSCGYETFSEAREWWEEAPPNMWGAGMGAPVLARCVTLGKSLGLSAILRTPFLEKGGSRCISEFSSCSET